MKKGLTIKLVIAILSLATLLCFAIGCGGGTVAPSHQHEFNQQIVNNAYLQSKATCTEKAQYYYSCTCGEKGVLTFEYGKKLEHSYKNYVYNNDAKCEVDGTETAICNYGCGITDTRVKGATALEHVYGKGVSNNDCKTHIKTCIWNSAHKTTENCSFAEGRCQDCGALSYTEGLVFTLSYYYEGYSVTDYTGSSTSVVIPNTYQGESVTNIGYGAFKDCTSLTSVTIGNSVTSIDTAFSGCDSLQSIEVDGNNQHYKSMDGNLYTKDGKTLLKYAPGKTATTFTIPDGVTSIGNSAFSYCSALTSIAIPNSVTSIGNSAFSYCSSLTSIAIPKSVTSIGYDAFSGCTSLTSIEIPNSVTSIGNYAFYDCSSLTSVVIPDSVTSIGFWAFWNCTSLTSVVIPNSVTSIGRSAFSCCSSLTSVVIPDSVTSIGDSTFYNCTSLTSVIIPKSVTSISDWAFDNCTSLKSIEVDVNNQHYKSIEGNLYTKDGKTLVQYAIGKTAQSFTILDSVTKVNPYAFFNCTSLTSIAVDANNQYYKSMDGNLYSKDGKSLVQYAIGKTAKSFAIPNGVTSICAGAFSYCALENIVIPNSVTEIGDNAFCYCTSLTAIEIPKSVTSIGDGLFTYCTNLSTIKFTGTRAEWYSIYISGRIVAYAKTNSVICTDGVVEID